MRRVCLLVALAALAGCGGEVVSESFSDVGETLASATTEPTPTPTPDERAAYRDAVCDVIDPLIMAAGRQMGPALDALAEDDAQSAARERAKLEVLADDVRDALELGPDYVAARTFETRLTASLDTFLEGLDAFERGQTEFDPSAFEQASGLFEASIDLYNEAKGEFQVVC